jgi:membrane associated rhomboid family serine protease
VTYAAPLDTAPSGPSPLALLIAHDLVTRYRLRLADSRDSRLGGLGAPYELILAGWTGPRAALVGFYTPPADPAAAGHDLAMRCDAARRWGHQRLTQQGASGCDVLLIALRPVSGALSSSLSPTEPVRLGAVWLDAAGGGGEQLLPIPPGMPSLAELRGRARMVQQGATTPTLAAVDLAERQAVAGGYVVPARRAMTTQPVLTYAFIAAWVLVYIVEKTQFSSSLIGADTGLVNLGSLLNSPPYDADWWRYVSSAFIHDPTDILHIVFNGLAMFWIGRIVEQLYGRLVLAGTFFITAAAGSLVWVGATLVGITPADGIAFGASGGIMGLVGLLLVLGRVQGRNVPAGLAAGLRQYAGLVIVINLIFGFATSGVNNFAHIGGLAAGALVGLVVAPRQHIGGRDLRITEQVVLGAAVAVGVVALVIAGVSYLQAGGASGLPAAS